MKIYKLSDWTVLDDLKHFDEVRGYQHEDSGNIDIYGYVYPASKKRDTLQKYICTLTPAQFEKVQKKVKDLVAQKQQEQQEREAKRLAEKQARESWLKKAISELILPEGFSVSETGEIFDHVGNYLFSLPKEPVDDINRWFKKEWKEFLKYCE